MWRAYYNDNDPYVAAWLRNLIAAGHLPDGDVDERSITEVRAGDVAGYTQVHFFAGIGGWPLALQLAGWPSTRPVWTGSCPCQPFSAAGKRRGEADERHLWPEFRRLIAECGPDVVFGEQVASDDGRRWLAGVRADLEDLGYGVGAVDLCAAGVGAPHIRQRLYWVGDASGSGRFGSRVYLRAGESRDAIDDARGTGSSGGGLADTDGWQPRDGGLQRGGEHGLQPSNGRAAGRLANAEYTIGRSEYEAHGNASGRDRSRRRSPWRDFYLVACGDGRTRRIGTGVQPLAHGVPARVGRLRAYGNAIIPQLAAEFVRAYMEAR